MNGSNRLKRGVLMKAALIILFLAGSAAALLMDGWYRPGPPPAVPASVGTAHAELTVEEKLEDFEYLFRIVSESFPYFWVNQRVYGEDWLGIKEAMRKAIGDTSNDEEFFMVLNTIIGKLHNGHSDVLTVKRYRSMLRTYEPMGQVYSTWMQVMKQPRVLARYGAASDGSDPAPGQTNESFQSCYRTDVIEPGKAALLQVSRFGGECVQKDRDGIYDFLKQVKDYTAILIDIRGNGGGTDQYWSQNLIPPLTNQTLTTKNYLLFRGGEYEVPFVKSKGLNLQDLKSVPPSDRSGFPPEAEEHFRYAYPIIKTIKPDRPVGFRGKIFLLVDRGVYSSSESFAAFSKASGWATLIGERTGGDGIGIDPLLFSLPNSGYVIRIPSDMGLNADGSSNDEKKTEPDIAVNPLRGATYAGDAAVQAALKLIP